MKGIAKVLTLALATFVVAAVLAPHLVAAPNPTSAVIKERIFNDCPSSVLTTTNNYPASIVIDDQNLSCGGFANLHVWRFSEDGATAVDFVNGDRFSFSADFVIAGTGGEGGLSVAPWWALDVDGRFNVRSTDGEIACFGGRLPFYSFTSAHGINYTAGEIINLEITYLSNSLTMLDPATIQYTVNYLGNSYTSGPLPFDEGNPLEDPPHGVWGMLTPANVGGYVQAFLQGGNPAAGVTTEWRNIMYSDLGSVVTEDSSWGRVKALFGE